MLKNKTFWVVLTILIIASFFRLYQIGTVPPGLYPDEAMNGNNALEALHTGDYKIFYSENNGREGLFMNIQAGFVAVFGNEPWVLRLPSAIFGIFTVLGLYFLGKELFSKQVGLISSFLLAASFWHILFSRIGFRAIMAPFFIVWACYFLIRALKDVGHDKRRSLWLAGIGGIFYGLGFYSYIAYRITPVIIFGIIFYFLAKKGQTFKVEAMQIGLIFLFITFLVALPLGIYFALNPADFMGRTSQVSVFSGDSPALELTINSLKTLGMFFFAGDYNWRHNLSGAPVLYWPVGILFLLGTVYGVRSIIKNRNAFEFWFIFGLFIFSTFPVVISNEGIPHALRAILMIPSVFLLAGVGGLVLYEFSKKHLHHRSRPIVFGILATLVLSHTFYAYFFTWAKNSNTQGAFSTDYVELGRELNSLPVETPKYVIVQAGGVHAGGFPVPAQTTMYITDTYLPEKQEAKNIFYVLPENESEIPEGALKFYIR